MIALLQRHILRLILFLAGCAALLDSPPAFIDGLPGPGIWPRTVGMALIACSALLPQPPQARSADTQGRKAAWGLVASSLLFIALTPLVGWFPASAVAAFFAASKAGCSRWEASLLASLLSIGLWLLVDHLLHWPLPDGLLGSFLDDLWR